MNFEKILEQYMDKEEIEKQLKIDKKELKAEKKELNKKNNKKNINKSSFIQTISINDFVVNYLGTEHDCENLKHTGLKSFKNPYVVGISNDFAMKNPDCVVRKEILVVIDAFGNPGTYINPELLKNIETMEQYKHSLSLLEKTSLHSLNNIAKLYNEYTILLNKMNELEKAYIEGVDLLRCLEIKKILKKLKKYALQASKKGIEFSNEQEDIKQNMDAQMEIINKLEQAISIKEETISDEYDEEDYEQIYNQINRQKTIIQRGRRSTVRRGD